VPELSWERLERALDVEARGPAREQNTDPAAAGQESAEREPASAEPPAPGAWSAPRPAHGARSGRWIALAWPIAALAATFVIGFMGLRSQPEPQPPSARAPSLSAPVERLARGWITLVAGRAELASAPNPRMPAKPGAEVSEQARLFVGADSELQLVFETGTGVALEGDTELAVARQRERAIELELVHGSLFQQVHKLRDGERYEVRFGPYVARVRGTRFRVEHGARSAVSVFEGRVTVHEGARLVADLSAGQRWSSRDENDAERDAAARADRTVHALLAREPARFDGASEPPTATQGPGSASSQTWPTLSLLAPPNVAAWRVDGSLVPARGGLSMRVPPGDLVLPFVDLRGQERSLTLRVAAEGAELGETAIQSLIAALNEPQGYLAPEQIEPVVRGGLDALRRCYERGLRGDSALGGKLVLSIRVAPDGHVVRARTRVMPARSDSGGDAPALPLEFESCIQATARGWRFPRPTGGAVVFELPLNLKSRQ
jgi:hypothetical protein